MLKSLTLKLTKDQLNGLDLLLKWEKETSFSNNDNIFVLAGAAGTGKSTLVKEFLHRVSNKTGIAVSAPTHPAVAVISNFTGRAGHTIHKLAGLRPDYNIDNFDINNLKFAKLGIPHIGDYNLLIIDESGMLKDDLIDYINELAKTHKTKVLYVGDHLQLPPPKVDSRKPHKGVFARNFKKYSLHEIVRQDKTNPVTILLAILRYELEKTKYNEEFLFNTLEAFSIDTKIIKAMKLNRNSGTLFETFVSTFCNNMINENGLGYITYNRDKMIDYKAFNKVLLENMQNTLKDPSKPNIFVAYTNETVEAWNKNIRKQLFDVEELISINDLLCGYETILDEFNVPMLFNSEEYIVTSVTPATNSYGIDGFLVNMKSVIDGTELLSPLFIINREENNINKYIYHFNELLTEATESPRGAARGKAFADFYGFKRQNLSTFTLYDSETKDYISKKSLDYGYCTTIHKSQGRTYNNVLVNLRDILFTSFNTSRKDKNLIKRLLYVAVSRATNNVYFLK